MENVNSHVISDTAPLKKVIVSSIGYEQKHVLPKFGYIGVSGFSSDILSEKAIRQHENFVKVLEKSNCQILYTADLINSALENLREKDLLTSWISENSPNLSKFLKSTNSINANDLLAISDRSFYDFTQNKLHKPLMRPRPGMFYTRDSAVMTPEGVIFSSFNNRRTNESKLTRLIFKYSDPLKDIPVVFDSKEEGVSLQGGDVIVLNEKTLLMGVDNLTESRAALLIAKKLNKNIIAVKLPRHLKILPSPFSSLFLHLDSIFNLIDKNLAIMVPYFFDKEFENSNPIYSILSGVSLNLNPILKINLKLIINGLKSVGNVVIYEAKTGNIKNPNQKLGDFLRKEYNIKILYTGGVAKSTLEDQVKHLFEIVLPEIRFMATNILATAPSELIIFDENTSVTKSCLINAGVKLTAVEGCELAKWNGGPHCMTLPISRY